MAGCPASVLCALNCTCPLCSRSRELFVTAIVTDLPLLILPLLGLRLTSDEPKDLVTVERHCTLCGPLLVKITVVERPSPWQSRLMLLGEMLSQSVGNGVAVGLGVAVGSGVAVAAFPTPGADPPVRVANDAATL